MTATGGLHPKTIPVFVVLPPQTLLLDVAGPLEVLRYASQHQTGIDFDCRYIATHTTQTTTIGLSLAGLEPLPDTLPENAMIVISGGGFQHQASAIEERRTLSRWLRRTVRDDTTIVSICSGALIAADAGLLDGRQCTTHADCIDELRRTAPLAQVMENRLFVEDGRCFSSAGISTGIDLMLHIVATLTSPMVAVSIARTMVIYLRRSGHDPQLSPWLSGRNHIHPAIHKVQDAIMADPANGWSLPLLSQTSAISERHLSRLFRDHTDMTVVDYINLMRVNLAHDILAHSRLDMETVAERSGFASARHLRRVWQQHYSEPPSFYRTLSA